MKEKVSDYVVKDGGNVSQRAFPKCVSSVIDSCCKAKFLYATHTSPTASLISCPTQILINSNNIMMDATVHDPKRPIDMEHEF